MATQRSSTTHRSIVTCLALVGSTLYALSFLELIDPQTLHRSLLDDANQPILKLLPGGGRIGDQLFMYAALLRLSHEHKMKPCIVKAFRRIPLQKMFVGPYEWCDDDDEHDVEWEGGWQAERVAKLRRQSGDSGLTYALSGYMHSPLNFVEYSPGLIYDALTLREDSDAYRRAHGVLKAFEGRGDDSIIKVGVHVRRGDKVTNKQYQTADADYFSRAMNYIRSKYNDDPARGNARRRVEFIVTSDSMPWVQKRTEVFGADDVTLVEHPFDPADPHDAFDSSQTDLAVLMHCDHMILSGGGFGFWSAFLGAHRKGGEVIVGNMQEKAMNSLDEWTNIDDDDDDKDVRTGTTGSRRNMPSSDEQVFAVE